MASEVKLMEIFPNPRDVGQSEYRAVYEHLRDFLKDCPEDERLEMCEGILEEFVESAQSMMDILDNHLDSECEDGEA